MLKQEKKCSLPTEVYSRVVGYFRPVANWNAGKKQEFSDRKTYVLKKDA
jgi:ribonucleoside-triphosphate reductase